MGPEKQRALLGLLALQPNVVVSRDEITDVLWGDRPPASSLNLVHTYTSRLRKMIERNGKSSGTPLISASRGGFVLTVDDDQLDLLRFDRFLTRARRGQDTAPRSASELLEQALRSWRGKVAADLPARVRQHPLAVAASGRRVAAGLAYADLALELGSFQQVVEHLQPIAADEPLHEGLGARLMLALAGSGQQAAALEFFTEIRRRLAEELGVEPGPEILAAHLRIVRQELPAVAVDRGRAADVPPSPAQLPVDITGFAGRAEHLAQLDATLRDVEDDSHAPVAITAISGTAGVGKTALAVHWAHRVRDHFPDGQLYVNLRGYASDTPVRPIEALTRFLRALGVAPERVPADEEEAEGLYRTLLTGRKVLFVLDNAASADQVRPLLPGSPGCFVLVTSRDRLTSLAAKEGAGRLALDVLDSGDAQRLLSRMIGQRRALAEPDAVAELADICVYLPLALRIVAANLASLPHTSVTDYVAELGKHGRLTELVIEGDKAGAVRASFDLSYAKLAPETRRLFRLLGLVPGPDFTAGAAAALLAGDVHTSSKLLNRLTGAHLVHEHVAGRYQFHDLLREYAADRARAEDGSEEIRTATERLFDYYLNTVDLLSRRLYAHIPGMPGPPADDVSDTDAAAIEQLDAEIPNLIAAARGCASGLQHYSWQMANSLRGYFVTRGHGTEGLAVCRAALAAAEQQGDHQAQASIYDIQGLIRYNLSDYPKAIGDHTRALALNRRTDNKAAEAGALHNLGRVHSQLGKPAQAMHYYEQALAINRRIENRHGEANALHYVGVAWLSLGQPTKAIEFHSQAMELSQQIASRPLELVSLHGLGLAYWALGQLDQAVRFYAECLTGGRRVGHKIVEATTLVCIAETNCDAGRYDEAEAQAELGLTLSRQLGERRDEVGALDVLATVHLRRGNHEAAARHYRNALHMARDIGFGYGEVSVLVGLAAVRRSTGRPADAVAHCREALAVMHDSGMRLLEGRALTGLAHGHLELGEVDQAAEVSKHALELVRGRQQRLAEARALQVLGMARRAAGEPDEAQAHWRLALEIFTDLGTPEAAELRTLLGSANPV